MQLVQQQRVTKCIYAAAAVESAESLLIIGADSEGAAPEERSEFV
jgi:hypothetical protein